MVEQIVIIGLVAEEETLLDPELQATLEDIIKSDKAGGEKGSEGYEAYERSVVSYLDVYMSSAKAIFTEMVDEETKDQFLDDWDNHPEFSGMLNSFRAHAYRTLMSTANLSYQGMINSAQETARNSEDLEPYQIRTIAADFDAQLQFRVYKGLVERDVDNALELSGILSSALENPFVELYMRRGAQKIRESLSMMGTEMEIDPETAN